MSTPSEIKTFIFLDTETTGLPRDENNRTKITELCMVAVQASHISQVEAEKITGLSNNLLEHQCSFSAETVNCINSFLNQNSKPICFVGHNANNFDYPILRREIEKTGCSLIDGVLCIDSINTFRDLHLEEVEARQSEGSSSHSVPLEFTAEYDQILCNTVEQLESGMSQTVVDAKRRNETTPIKHKTETATFSEPTPKKFKVMPSKLQLNFDQDISNKIDGLEGKLKNIEQKYDTTIAELEQKAQTFEIENIELRKRLIDVERKLKRKNLIFYGIVEEIGENVKKEIIKNRRNLKGSNIYISEDQTTEDRKERKVLVEHLKLARSKNKLAQLKGNKLVIDGEIYVYADLEHKEHDGYYSPPPTREASSAPATPSTLQKGLRIQWNKKKNLGKRNETKNKEQKEENSDTEEKKRKFENSPNAHTGAILKIPRTRSEKRKENISFRLGDVYTRLTKNRPTNEHRAEGDVLMLLTCAATLGDKFVDWSNSNAKNFCDIPPMVPGKKCGT
ncbi:hypothetical protein NQ317_010084 [Molorchus minor]|uniref:Exonuclease domain-containing protein n=1 Tax=Molorchus minor TaxID=1323400 RepID=A0ABQ9JJW0_9CUCU|nr:hypothetical protein NQ317_010084 [Molorchus minor]